MKFVLHLYLRLRWLYVPGALLAALLQRTPALRAVAVAGQWTIASPLGAVLRPAIAAVASLGALHTLAGATQFIASRNPVTGTVGTTLSPASITVTGAQTPAGSFRIVSGSLPAGLAIPGLNTSTNIVNGTSFTITGTPTVAGNSSMLVRAFEFANAQGDSFPATAGFQVNFSIAGATNVAPAITTQPVSQTVNAGASVTFTAAASGTPTPTLQWAKDGVNISGATNATLTIASAQASDAGSYTIIATNSVNSATSNAATLTVNAVTTSPPVIAAQPVPQSIAMGSTVVFNTAATGATSFQWRKNGSAISGATRAILVLASATGADAGSYSVDAINATGTASSNAAMLALSNVPAKDVGRLINLSILTPLAAGETMTMGTVLGGANTSGTKALLARAVGPSLAQLGVSGTLPDPQMTLSSRSAIVATNNDWGGTAALSNAFAQVGAFAYSSDTSKDAAIFQSALATGDYTVQVSDAGGASGAVIAELYDSTSASTVTAGTPRLINVSVLKSIAAGSTLTAGFVIGGTTARTVLVRAIGPGLAQFGFGGFMPDPQLALFNSSSTKIAENDNWGGDPQLTTTGTNVGAFALASANSRDAMILVTLSPGNYTAQVSGVGGAGGSAIVEVYEVP